MGSLGKKIKDDVIAALKGGEKEKAATLRLLQAAIKDREIDLKKREQGLSDDEILEVILREAKKRRDSIEAYRQGGRQDLVDQESAELGVLQEYLPQELSEDEMKKEVMKAIQEVGATSSLEMGKVMSALMPRVKGRADGAKLSALVRQMLEA